MADSLRAVVLRGDVPFVKGHGGEPHGRGAATLLRRRHQGQGRADALCALHSQDVRRRDIPGRALLLREGDPAGQSADQARLERHRLRRRLWRIRRRLRRRVWRLRRRIWRRRIRTLFAQKRAGFEEDLEAVEMRNVKCPLTGFNREGPIYLYDMLCEECGIECRV